MLKKGEDLLLKPLCHKDDKNTDTLLHKFEKSHPTIRQQNKLILHGNNDFF